MIYARAAVLTAAIVMAPFSAWAADLVCAARRRSALRNARRPARSSPPSKETGKGLDYRLMSSRNQVANTIAAVSDAKSILASSIRRNQAKVSSGNDDTNNKTFFDY
jgi:hypothetical protein